LLANQFYKPKNIDEVVRLLSQKKTAKILAGGTDLIIALRERKMNTDAIIDISDIPELKQISTDGNSLHIGSVSNFNQIESDKVIRKYCPILAEAASQIGGPAIRSRATIGGNIANNAAAGDMIPVLLALDAIAVVINPYQRKVMPVGEIVNLGLSTDELIIEFIIHIHEHPFMKFEKIGRRKALAISRVNLAVVMTFSENKSISGCAIGIGAVGKTAYRLNEIEQYLIGKQLNDEIIEEAARKTDFIVFENLGTRKTAPYKRKIAATLMKNILEIAMEDFE